METTDGLLSQLSRHTIPVYRPKLKDSDYVPEQIGSASIVKLQNKYYIVTAGHILDDADLCHLSFGEIDELQLNQCFAHYQNDDEIDVGVIQITDTIKDQIVSYGLDIIDLDNKSMYQCITQITNGSIMLIGYPVSQQKLRYGLKQLRVICKIIIGKIIPTSTRSNKIRFAIKYDRDHLKRGNDQNVTGPNPVGMSGSPTWLEIGSSTSPMQLTGVAIEYFPKEDTILITRIEVVLRLIEEIDKKGTLMTC